MRWTVCHWFVTTIWTIETHREGALTDPCEYCHVTTGDALNFDKCGPPISEDMLVVLQLNGDFMVAHGITRQHYGATIVLLDNVPYFSRNCLSTDKVISSNK